MTHLEVLPNELLLELFKFFNVPELFRVFDGLNSRLNNLLWYHFQSYHLDLRSISKNDFDTLCDEYLLQIINEITVLRLSNDDDTPQQVERFLSHDNLLGQFTRLRVFSLYHVRSKTVMNKISFQLKHLSTLTHLNIIQCCFSGSSMCFFWLYQCYLESTQSYLL